MAHWRNLFDAFALGLAVTLVLLHIIAALGFGGSLMQWHRAQDAQQGAIEQLREFYLAQAQARRFSGRPGRRFVSLDVLAKAAATAMEAARRRYAGFFGLGCDCFAF